MKRENLKSSHRKKTYYIQRIKDIADISLGVYEERRQSNSIFKVWSEKKINLEFFIVGHSFQKLSWSTF